MKITVLLLGLFAIVPFAFAADTVVTPEPGTVVMLATGLTGFGFVAWRRKRNQ